ncbi:serine protease 1-like [Drosophila takahashii]|uniref:serine protease 1-like n=1 Tax=Drosophila takahashii TaxID=29030 RepID=UPI001CF85EFD|nr:serine protease 1-like [Drosophila takahashii]
MKVFVVVILAIATVSAGVLPQVDTPVHPRDLVDAPSIEGRITNGNKAASNQFPYQVGLAFKNSAGSWWCGGSIIANTWVLTAAHCTNGASSVTIYYGSTLRTSAKLKKKVSKSKFVQHASYKAATLQNDISLIKTPSVKFTAAINKITLPSIASSNSSFAGQTAIASGWGTTSDYDSSVTSYLQYAELQVISNAVCQQTYGSSIVTSGVICVASTNKRSTCQGDSGGPLALNGKLIGVTSFVSALGCEKNKPAGFTRVTSHLDWIKTKSAVFY